MFIKDTVHESDFSSTAASLGLGGAVLEGCQVSVTFVWPGVCWCDPRCCVCVCVCVCVLWWWWWFSISSLFLIYLFISLLHYLPVHYYYYYSFSPFLPSFPSSPSSLTIFPSTLPAASTTKSLLDYPVPHGSSREFLLYKVATLCFKHGITLKEAKQEAHFSGF